MQHSHKSRLSIFSLAVLALCAAVSGSGAQAREENLRLEVARQWAEKGEYDKAVQELRVYLSEHPDSSRIYARIGGLRMKQGDFLMAAENYKVALAKNPEMKEARDGLAAAYEKSGNTQKAKEIRAAAAPGKKTSGPPAAGGENDYAPALDSGASPGSEGIYSQKEFLEAIRFYREKKPDSLTAALRRTLAKTPGHPGAYYLGGVMRFDRGELDKAIYNFKRGLDYPGRGHNAHFYLGRIHERQGRDSEAIAAFEKYLALAKSESGRKQAEAHLQRLRGGGSKTTAKPKTQTADKAPKVEEPPSSDNPPVVEKKPGPPEPKKEAKPEIFGRDGSFFFILPDASTASGQRLIEAHEASRQEKFEKAGRLLQETVLEYGGSANAEAAILNLASVYLRLGLWENARARMADYLGALPRDSVRYWDAAHYLAAVAHLGLKNGEKAEKNLLALDPNSPQAPTREEIDFRLSQAGELMKDVKKWSAYLDRAYASARSPGRKAALAQQLGMLHAKYGDAEKAAGYYRKSMAECGDSAMATLCAESHIRLADLAFGKKDWKTALDQYRQFAAKYPGHGESAWIHYQIANIQKSTRNFESALNGYKSVIDNYPESYWASQAKWKREDAIWQKEFEEVLD